MLRAERDDALGRVLRTMYLTAAMTGLRQGEFFGLRWRDVDWQTLRLRVRQSYVAVPRLSGGNLVSHVLLLPKCVW